MAGVIEDRKSVRNGQLYIGLIHAGAHYSAPALVLGLYYGPVLNPPASMSGVPSCLVTLRIALAPGPLCVAHVFWIHFLPAGRLRLIAYFAPMSMSIGTRTIFGILRQWLRYSA